MNKMLLGVLVYIFSNFDEICLEIFEYLFINSVFFRATFHFGSPIMQTIFDLAQFFCLEH